MEPKSLSASALLSFENCPAGYKADYIDRVPELSTSTAGDLGSALHETLEFWITSGQYLKFEDTDIQVKTKALNVVWEMCYWNWFVDRSRYADGWEMLLKWLQRTHWHGRTVLEVEVKKTFELQTSRGPLPITYILDRKDRLDNGEIEVVDYKSWARPVQPDDLRDKIQPRLYALAIMIEHKDEGLRGVWVTLDQLRYDPVSVFFTRDDCTDTYRYLQNAVERVYASDGTAERLNDGCRWCSRKLTCETLLKHVEFGGVMGITTLDDATVKLATLQAQKAAIESALEQLADHTLSLAEDAKVLDWQIPGYKAKVTAKGRRGADSERIAQIVGGEIMARYGGLTIAKVEEIIKNEDLTDDQKSQIKQLITKTWGKAYVEIKPVTDFKE